MICDLGGAPNFYEIDPCCKNFLHDIRWIKFVWPYPPASEASREIANLTEIENLHTHSWLHNNVTDGKMT